MAPFPLAIDTIFARPGVILIYFLIGLAFGYVLEISGFGNSKKLAAQFYFKELTVLKVMFGAIVTAMVLIFLATGVGLLDYNLVWVNPTYLWPGIVGGLIMGVGFIVGGFCPGTSLVAAATGKLDGIMFAAGVAFGIFLFGETVDNFSNFYNSSYFGRLTVMDWLGLPAGVVVLGVILMALFMFWGAEQLERIFGKRNLSKEPRLRLVGAGALVTLALAGLLIGQPDNADRWARLEPAKGQQLSARQVQIHPGELLATFHDHKVNLVMLDLRDEADYNLFHIKDAKRVEMSALISTARELQLEPANTVVVLMSNDEAAASDAWRVLTAESVPNVYILEGGINYWLRTFAHDEPRITLIAAQSVDDLAARFAGAMGSQYSAANPDPEHFELQFIPKIKLEGKKGGGGGGCG